MQALLKRPALLAGGGIAYVGGVVLAYEYLSPKPPLPSACERCCTFNALAPSYDAEIERDEASSGILELRREITAYAKGRVLEVAGGTGRNLAFYTEAVSELLVTDFSQDMLKVGAGKVAKLRAAEGGAPGLSNVTLAVVDAAAMPLESAQYDTVVDSFGICSFEEPQAALQEMKRWSATSPSPSPSPWPSPNPSPNSSPSPNPNQLQAERYDPAARARREQLGHRLVVAAAPPQPARGALGLLLGQGHPGVRQGRRPTRGRAEAEQLWHGLFHQVQTARRAARRLVCTCMAAVLAVLWCYQ